MGQAASKIGGAGAKGAGKGGGRVVDDIPVAPGAQPGVKAPGTVVGSGASGVIKHGDKVDDAIQPVSTTNMSAAAKSSVDEIAAANPGSKLADAGKKVVGQVTFTRVAVVTGGVVVAVILIDPDSGQKIAENTAAATAAFVQPFIPSLLSSCIPLSTLMSMAVVAMMMFQQMR